ncbi:MAG: aldo/keto reductase [Nocardioides sp.]
MSDLNGVATKSGTFDLGGDLPVARLGYGAMQLPGRPGVWGWPDDPENATRVLRRAVELGIDFIDTSDAYGPHVNEEQIKAALHPYPDGLVIATKAGLLRPSRESWQPCGLPAYLRQECESSLRRLGLERIDLFQLHRIDPAVPLEDQVGELKALQGEGKIRHIGLSEVTVAELQTAQAIAPIASVQNLYNLADRSAEDLLDYCTAESIGFIPWYPLAAGALAEPGSALSAIAERLDATPAQVALAWLLRRSPVMLPIPGTSKIENLENNTAAAGIELTDQDFDALSALVTA